MSSLPWNTGGRKWSTRTISTAIAGFHYSSIPLIVPGSCVYDRDKNIVTLPHSSSSNEKLTLIDDALAMIKSINDKEIGIISICGPYHTGKSYFLSQILGAKDVFKVGSEYASCTRGIWMATTALECDEFVILLLDTEGLDAPDIQSDLTLNNLMTLTTLLSSFMIYNTYVPRRTECNTLQFITLLSHQYLISGENSVNYFPDFLWLIRDASRKFLSTPSFTDFIKNLLRSNETGKEILKVFSNISCTALPNPTDDPSENDNPDFDSSVHEVCKTILVNVKPKNAPTSDYISIINGDHLANIIGEYLKSINEFKLPDIHDAYKSTIILHLESHKEKLVEEYESLMSDKLHDDMLPLEDPCYPELTSNPEKGTFLDVHFECYKLKHDELSMECGKFKAFSSESNVKLQFKSETVKILSNFRERNFFVSQQLCEKKFRELFWNKENLKNDDLLTLKESYLLEAKGPAKQSVMESQMKLLPDPPTKVVAKQLSYNCVQFSWQPSKNADIVSQYKVILMESQTDEVMVSHILPKASQSKTFDNLLSNKEYNFKICGMSIVSNEFKGIMAVTKCKVNAECPKKPVKPEVKIVDDPITENIVKVSFTEPSPDDCRGSEVTKIELEVSEKDITLLQNEMSLTRSKYFMLQLQRIVPVSKYAKKILFRIRFYNAVGNSDWSPYAKLKVSKLVPGPPENLRRLKITPTAITLIWDEPKTFACSCDFYFVEINQNGKKKLIGTSCTTEFSELQPDTEYEIKVWSANMTGICSEEAKVCVRTRKDVPSIPEKLSVKFVPNDYNKVELSGNLPKDNGSCLTKKDVCVFPGSKFLSEESITTHKIIDLEKLGLPIRNTNEIKFKVRYFNKIGPSKWSPYTAISCTNLVPLKARNLAINTSKAYEIKLTWYAPELYRDILKEYIIQCKTESDPVVRTQHVPKKDKNEIIFKNCRPNTEYKIILQSVSYYDRKRSIEKSIKTKLIPPKKPDRPSISFDESEENLQKVNVTVMTPTLEDSNWSVSYRFRLLVRSDIHEEIFYYDIETHKKEQSKLVPLNHGSKCTYYIFASSTENKAGWSEWSESDEVHVSRFHPGEPQAIKLDATSRAVKAEWAEPLIFPKAVDYYEVIIEGPSDPTNSIEPKCPLKSYQSLANFKNLLPASNYTFTISVVNKSGKKNKANCILFETEKAPPEKPKKCMLTPNSENLNEYRLTIMMPHCNGDPINRILVRIDHFLYTEFNNKVPYTLPDSARPYVVQDDYDDIVPEDEFNDVIIKVPDCPYNGEGELVYEIQTGCYNKIGCSELSACNPGQISASKLIPGRIKELVTHGTNENSMKISWDLPEYPYSISLFRIFIKNLDKNCDLLYCDTFKRKVLVSGLKSDTQYSFQICTVNGENKRGKLSDKLIISTEVMKAYAATAAAGAGIAGALGGPITAVVATVKEINKQVENDEVAIPIVLGASTLLSPVTGVIGAPFWGMWAGRQVYKGLKKETDTNIDDDTVEINYNEKLKESLGEIEEIN